MTNPAYVSHSSTCGWYPQMFQCLYPLLGALIGRSMRSGSTLTASMRAAITRSPMPLICMLIVTHQTCLVQWTWNVLLIWDYPGVSNECDPHSSHPLYENPLRRRRIPEEMTILRRVMAAWHLADNSPSRMSQEAEEMKEKWKRKAQITFLVPSVKFRHPMLAFRFFEYLICFWSY